MYYIIISICIICIFDGGERYISVGVYLGIQKATAPGPGGREVCGVAYAAFAGGRGRWGRRQTQTIAGILPVDLKNKKSRRFKSHRSIRSIYVYFI